MDRERSHLAGIVFAFALALVTSNVLAQVIPDAMGDIRQSGMQLYLQLIVNGQATEVLAPVSMDNGHFIAQARDLRAAGLVSIDENAGDIDLSELDGVTVTYLSATQQLLLAVPNDWLAPQSINFASQQQYKRAQASLGAAFTYDLYLNKASAAPSVASLFNELRIFGNTGTLRSTGMYRRGNADSLAQTSEFIRYDTSWRMVDQDKLMTYEAGDLVTNGLPWSSVVRLGGIQLSREYQVRPDIITYPLPQFSGSAAVPSAVDVFVNGYKMNSATVNPGPFTLTDMPYVNGAGEATLVTTDAQGRQISTTAPFYVASQLLKKGFYSYSVSAGALREDFGLSSFSYGDVAGSASLRYGLNDAVTLETHAEAAQSLNNVGVGTSFLLKHYGVMNVSVSRSDSAEGPGLQQMIGYQFAAQNFSVSMQHTRRDPNYRDLASTPGRSTARQRRSSQVFGGINFGRFGSLGVGYLDAEYETPERIRLTSLSWSKPFRNSAVLLSVRREPGKEWSVVLQFNRQLGRRSNVNVQLEDDEGAPTSRIAYQSSVPTNGGFGWNLVHNDGGSRNSYSQADLAWRGSKLEARAGHVKQRNESYSWGELQGGLVWMKGQVLASQRFNDSFVLVSTVGVPDIPVSYENQVIGKTNRKGFLLVPFSASFYESKYSIDILNLPANISGRDIEKTAIVKPGAGLLLEFPLRKTLSAQITVVGSDGEVIAPGAEATLASGETTFVGWDGLVFFENLEPANNHIAIQQTSGDSCHVQFDLDANIDTIQTLGPLTCE